MIHPIDQLTGDELRKILMEQKAILDNATVGILFSRNRMMVSSNVLGAEMFGYTPDEMIGLPGAALYPSAQAYAELGRSAGQVLAAGQALHTEVRFCRKDGSLFWGRVSAKAVDPLNTQDGTIWIVDNIDDERVIREALDQSISELGAIFETAIIGIAVIRERKIARCNRGMDELFGYASGEMIGMSTRLWYLSDEEYESIGNSAYSDLMQNISHQREQEFRRKDGSIFWGRLFARGFVQNDPMSGLVVLIEDITDSKLGEERARKAFEEQELIFNNAAVGMMFVRNRIVRRCNRKFEEIFGYAEGELVGNSTLVLYPTVREYDDDGARDFEKLMRGESVIDERRVRRKDGSLFWVLTTCRKTDVPGHGLDVIWIFEDVTERHQAEDALVRAHDELERRVIERTTELATTNKQLQDEIFERLQAEQRIWHMAHHDTLTGLPNRSLLHDRLDQALTQAGRSNHRLAVMFLDLDRFKNVNDTLGHHIGDQLLKHVAGRLRDVVRAVDTVSRLGGDEFVVVLHEIQHSDDAMMVAEKIIAALAMAVEMEGHTLHATPSIGISIYPDDGEEAYALMKNADTAMYHAKANGRNNFQFFAANMNEETKQFFGIEQKLRLAIEQNQFRLQFQPQIDHRLQAVCGMEALVRWEDPEHGLIYPGDFIPVAEETGLILQLGEWVLREACRQNGVWQAQGYPALPIAVNLSPRQFRQKGVVDTIRRILDETGQSPELLELEITETTLMHDADETLTKLRQLAEMGIKLAIDDFGTGYSSLAYLKRFPVHKLKIDQGFVHDLDHDRDDAVIVATIIVLAHSLGLEVVAEGVENEGQLARLINYCCHKFQGYHFSHPLTAEDAALIFNPIRLR